MSKETDSKDRRGPENGINYNLQGGRAMSIVRPEDKIVITGISGLFPDSNNVRAFKENLFNKVDMVQPNRRWTLKHPEIPGRTGSIPDIAQYDTGFFGVHEVQSQSLDPMLTLLQEKTIEAIFDAGLHPSDLENTRTGVFVGACYSENDRKWCFDNLGPRTYAITGSLRSMIAHRLSYFLKLKGPSHTSDTACSSSLYALDNAYRLLRTGEIDSAIVAGTNLCLHPFVNLQFARLGVLSMDGACKSFDEQGNGYVRSEAIAVLLLQKVKDAKRLYAEIVHVKANCDGYKEQGITFPSKNAQGELLTEFYDECGVDRYSLSFLEAHGTGTLVGDPEECSAIDEVFTKERTRPLLIGSVKSNIGHSESASGVCSIIKSIIGMETGLIPPNIHFHTARGEIKGIQEGRMKVVTENQPFQDERGLIGINSFGFGGGNCHVLLRWNPKAKRNKSSSDNLPRLVCLSGRTEQAVLSLLDSLTDSKFDVEYIKLLHEGFRKNVPNHLYRGYSIVTNSAEITRSTKFLKHSAGNSPPLYFFFGELNDWYNTGCQLMVLPAFSTSFKRMQEAFLKHQINILNDLFKKPLDRETNRLLGSVVVQLCLIDTFSLMEIKPNGTFGYPFGKLLSTYIDGALSLEDTVCYAYVIIKALNGILNSKAKGKCMTNGDTIDGNHIPNGNNTQNENETIAENLKACLINKDSIQMRETLLHAVLKESGSFKTDIKIVKYFVDAIFNDVPQDANKIKPNSVALVLGEQPSCDFQNISVIKLLSGSNKMCLEAFLKTVGRLYEHGYNPQISKLYPPVEFPVSRGTPMISSHIKWNHRKPKYIPQYEIDAETDTKSETSIFTVPINISDYKWRFVEGHEIDGRNLFPATGYLYIVWQSLADMKNLSLTMMQVCFENCKFLRATTVPKKDGLTLQVSIQRASGKFEVVEGDSPVVTGKISLLGANETSEDLSDWNANYCSDSTGIKLKSKDIYKELRLRGYNYKGEFRAIEECNSSVTDACIKWEDNWITFIDNMLQLKILQSDTRLLYVPTYISKLTILAKTHLELIARETQKGDKSPILHVSNDSITGQIRCGGINLWGLIATSIPRKKILGVPVLENYKFVPNQAVLDINQSVRVNTQIILENALSIKVKAVELIDEFTQKDTAPLSPIVKSALEDQPLILPFLKIFSKTPLEDIEISVEDKKLNSESDCSLVIGSNLLDRPDVLKEASNILVEKAFIITRESQKYDTSKAISPDFTIFTIHHTPNETLLLLQKQSKTKPSKYIKITPAQDFHWLPELQNSITKGTNENIILYAENEPKSGILGLVNCLRREPPSKNVRCLFMMDKAEEFNPQLPFYSNQLKKQMAINIYKDGQWGTYRHLLLDEKWDTESEHCFANVTVRGDLSSLRWFEGPLRHNVKEQPESQLIHVYYCALNFRDIMTASGKINADVVTRDRLMQECIQGLEYAGRDRKGNRVMGMIPFGALSTLILADVHMQFRVPDNWTLEEAATVPAVYGTVVYALIMRGRMARGESILIHSGTGGVGQAAIRIALHYGCTVFTTVGSQEKRDFLKNAFPQLKDNNIGNSHDESFEQLVYKETNGRGVDLVLNSLAEEKLVTSVKCLARGGRFIEIGKFDMANNNHLNLLLFQKEASFEGVMLDQLFNDPPEIKKQLMDLMVEAIKCGAIKPLNRTIFGYDELEKAFKFMATGKHMGKVLIQIRKPEKELIVAPPARKFPGISRFFCDPEKVYIVTGGLGGFGLELADWLILRGARKVVLTSRKGITSGYQNYRINIWNTYQVTVKISTADITTKNGCEQLIKECLELGRIDAIFNLAVVLADGLFENQTPEGFVTSFGPKAYSTEYLDQLTRKLCPDLRDFVVFSSVSCGRGNAGQTNYGMSNSVMERICEDRRRAGYPALAIEWGAIGEVGLVAEMLEDSMEMEISGTLQQRISSCLQVMDSLMTQKNAAIVSSIVVAEKKGDKVADNIIDAVINVLGISDSKSVSLHSTLPELGMDSMTAVEIKQVLERDFEVFLSAKDIRTMTLAKLKDMQMTKLGEDSKEEEEVHFGMEMMFRKIGGDVDNYSPYVKLKSRVSEDSEAPTVVVFPGIEGLASTFIDLAKNLNVHTVAVQLTMEKTESTVVELAQSVIPTVEKFFPNSVFTLISYSYGTLIALEVVHILESRGYSGTLLIIDGAPMLTKQMVMHNFSLESMAIFETALICHMMSFLVSSDEIEKHKENIFKCATWDERLNIALVVAKDQLTHEDNYYRLVISGICGRIKTLMNYSPSFTKFKSNIKLFKPTAPTLTDLPEDYGLSTYCEKPIEIQTFAGNHTTILNNEGLANVINSFLIS